MQLKFFGQFYQLFSAFADNLWICKVCNGRQAPALATLGNVTLYAMVGMHPMANIGDSL